MSDALVLLAIFVALTLLALQFAKITLITLIVLFLAAVSTGVVFLSLGLRGHF